MSESLNSSIKGSVDDRRQSHSATTRVLVVDDDRDICEFLEIALGTLGQYEVEIATRASEAFLAIDNQKEPFDCLLLDIQMPMMTGVTLCDSVRKIPGYQSVPIIMLTAMGERKYLDDAFAAGATDYMTKPFDLTELRTRIGRSRRLCSRQPHQPGDGPASTRAGNDGPASGTEPAEILGLVDRFVGENSFKNYVMQSVRQEYRNAFVRAVNLVDSEHLFATLPLRDVQVVLFEVANMMAEETTRTGGVLSYRGDGVFLYMGHGNSRFTPKIAEARLRRNARLAGIYEDFDLNVELVFGEQIKLDRYSKGNVLFALNDAVQSLRETGPRSPKWTSFSEWYAAKSKSNAAQDRFDQNAYKLIFQDILSERDRSN